MSNYELIVAVIGLLIIGSLGTCIAYRKARSKAERSFVFKAVALQGVVAVGWLFADWYFSWGSSLLALATFVVLIIPIMIWVGWKLKLIRAQENNKTV